MDFGKLASRCDCWNGCAFVLNWLFDFFSDEELEEKCRRCEYRIRGVDDDGKGVSNEV